MILTRRQFLAVSSALIATPVIAKVALVPGFKIPEIQPVRAMSRSDLMSGEARFASAIFTPGNFWAAREVIQIQVAEKLPYETCYEIRAVPFDTEEMTAATRYRYKRPGYAVCWVADADMQKNQWGAPGPDYELLGRFISGHSEIAYHPIESPLYEGGEIVLP